MHAFLDSLLLRIEKAGNRLPDPATLFVILIGLVVIFAWLAAATGLSVIHPGTQAEIRAVNLLTSDQLRRVLVEMPQTFAGFPPLGLVLVVMLGIGIADKTGLIFSVLKLFINKVPAWSLSAALVFAGIMSSLAADAGYVFLLPVGAVLFLGAGRHPLAGLAAAFAGVSAGFSANLLLTALDPLLAGLSESAAQIVDPDYTVLVTANYYLMVVLVPFFTLVGAILTDKFIEPRLGAYQCAQQNDHPVSAVINTQERKALYAALIVTVIYLLVVAMLVLPENAPLRDSAGGYKPFYQSLIALMFFFFLLPGLCFGIFNKKISSDRDAVKMAADSMADMGHYIVLAFLAAHFIALFKWSNLGLIVAVSGAELLHSAGFTGLPLLVAFILVAASVNLFVGSASAKWAVMAPVFVPMLMLLGYSPELTQAAYRIGDSVTNVLTPLLPYFPLVIVFAKKYMPDFGIGSLVAMMLPYSAGFGIVSVLILIIWVVSGAPLGPDVPLYYQR